MCVLFWLGGKACFEGWKACFESFQALAGLGFGVLTPSSPFDLCVTSPWIMLRWKIQ